MHDNLNSPIGETVVVGTVEERRDSHDKIEIIKIEHGHVPIITPDYAGVPIPQDHRHLSLWDG